MRPKKNVRKICKVFGALLLALGSVGAAVNAYVNPKARFSGECTSPLGGIPKGKIGDTDVGELLATQEGMERVQRHLLVDPAQAESWGRDR